MWVNPYSTDLKWAAEVNHNPTHFTAHQIYLTRDCPLQNVGWVRVRSAGWIKFCHPLHERGSSNIIQNMFSWV